MNLKSQHNVEGQVRVALVGDCELVHAGLAAVLGAAAGRVRLVPVDSTDPIDVLLFDPVLASREAWSVLARRSAQGARVVLFSWNPQEAARRIGRTHYDACLSKSATGAELASCVESVLGSERSTLRRAPVLETSGPDRVQLTAREEDVLCSIVRGLSNDEICRSDYVTINTLKSHIRHLYRKIGVTRRSQAVVWGVRHGYADAERAGQAA